MNYLLDIVLENIRIVAYMFSVVFSGYLVTNYSNTFLLLFRHPVVQLMMGTFLAMSMIDFRKNEFKLNLINLVSTTITFMIMLYILKYVGDKMEEKKDEYIK